MKVLVINCGSSTVKFKVLDVAGRRELADGTIECGETVSHGDAIAAILDSIGGNGHAGGHDIGAVGHRVVHGGPDFSDAVRITDDVVAAIEACVPLAPLHNPANLAGIEAARAALPDIPHVAVFDTAFHNQMPRRSRTYAIPVDVADRLNARRYGFHGSSHAFVAQAAADHLQRPLNELRIITCHLGNGASVCAVELGRSVDTSMGMTPLEGLVMGTRSGDVDAGLVLQIAREIGIDETDHLLNRSSGLAGLTGLGKDLREIEAQASQGHDGARLSIAVFAHRVRKYIGAYAAVMGGVDAIVMTGGIGENSVTLRRRILQRLEFLGVRLDEDRNAAARVDDANPVAAITAPNSRVPALAVATNEELMIAQQTAKLAAGAAKVVDAGPIPIAVSARHVHLNRETFALLFGEDAKLTRHKDLSQPGQFASQQRVNLVGPRDRIDRVRILGPLRGRNQIEISRTDEFRLGVDAPIRRSGRVKGSAPIKLEGPNGTVSLEEGLVCAWRHIHMTTADAARYGVSDGDEVEIKITGGPRDLTFGDVLVRVKDSYLLEMHIDTDEANAAELGRVSEGTLVYTDIPSHEAHLQLKRVGPSG